ncbi:MAG: hypothetical protein U0547_02285 [Dehalococcoidia bacterium]
MTTYHERAAREIATEHPSRNVTPIMRKLVDDSRAMLRRSPADAKTRAAAARADAIGRLEELHAQVRAN